MVGVTVVWIEEGSVAVARSENEMEEVGVRAALVTHGPYGPVLQLLSP
jgi:hypothetical protein